jgi:hypothetical protein
MREPVARLKGRKIMALGLPKSVLEAEISHELIYSGLDQRAAKKISDAIAEAIDKNNRRIQQQLADSGIDALLSVMSEPQSMIRRADVI